MWAKTTVFLAVTLFTLGAVGISYSYSHMSDNDIQGELQEEEFLGDAESRREAFVLPKDDPRAHVPNGLKDKLASVN